MNIPFVDLKEQFIQIEHEIMPILSKLCADGEFIGGPQVEAFEEEFAAFCDSHYCIGVNSGTDALRFALIAAGVGTGDEVITVPNTFIATSEAITQAGARPVFTDVVENTWTMDPKVLERHITSRTRAIIPVHLYGQPAEMDAIQEIAGIHGIPVIEDACQAHGAQFKGRKAGSMGLAGCFSFYPGKNLGAFGEGGAVVTQDEELAHKIRLLRNHGQAKKYYHQIEGYNGRLDTVQAAVLRIKLKHLSAWNEGRRRNAAYYNDALSHLDGIEIPRETDGAVSVYHLYVIHSDQRDALQEHLARKGIATGLHYPLPLHKQAAYRHCGYAEQAFPVAERSAARLLSLPMFPELTSMQMDYVLDTIQDFMNHSG
jgi:dTDP-4-amino-4,6-dideoxygalactose transaminase